MAKWIVDLEFIGHNSVIVDADSEDGAVSLAMKAADSLNAGDWGFASEVSVIAAAKEGE